MPVLISLGDYISKYERDVPNETQCLTCIESNAISCLLKVDLSWTVIFVQIAIVEGIQSLKNGIERNKIATHVFKKQFHFILCNSFQDVMHNIQHKILRYIKLSQGIEYRIFFNTVTRVFVGVVNKILIMLLI